MDNQTYSFAKLTFQFVAFLREDLINSTSDEGVFDIDLKFQSCSILHDVILTQIKLSTIREEKNCQLTLTSSVIAL